MPSLVCLCSPSRLCVSASKDFHIARINSIFNFFRFNFHFSRVKHGRGAVDCKPGLHSAWTHFFKIKLQEVYQAVKLEDIATVHRGVIDGATFCVAVPLVSDCRFLDVFFSISSSSSLLSCLLIHAHGKMDQWSWWWSHFMQAFVLWAPRCLPRLMTRFGCG
jgi:hypothetical protein